MHDKTLTLTLAIIGLMGIGETASAVTFNCPNLDVSKIRRGVDSYQQSSYIYRPPPIPELKMHVIYSQSVVPSLTLSWTEYRIAEHVMSDNPEDPKSKHYNLVSVTFKDASLGYAGHPICNYVWDFSGLIFSGGKSYIEVPITANNVQNCTLSGTTFTCP